jgi:hypothetical protein
MFSQDEDGFLTSYAESQRREMFRMAVENTTHDLSQGYWAGTFYPISGKWLLKKTEFIE